MGDSPTATNRGGDGARTAASMAGGERIGLGLRGTGPGRGLEALRGGRGWHGSRGWPACGTEAEDGRRQGDACGARRAKQRGEEADRWARARKIKRLSLKFEKKVFLGSKIHQIFTGDR
jgi:hypothetical protein